MFNLLPADIPYRGKNRMRHLRTLARQNVALGMGQVDDMWMPMPNGMMAQSFMNSSGRELPNRFEEIVGLPLSRSMSSTDIAYGSHYLNEFSHRDDHPSFVMPFERAATALNNTLDSAIKFCKEVGKQFENETLNVAVWADPKCIDSLWTMKLDWNGVPASEYARSWDIQPASTIVTYNMVVKSLHRAVDELRVSDGPSTPGLQQLDRSQQSPERVRTTLKKLLVTFEGIEELMDSVRTRRERMMDLQKELVSAQSMLRDIRDLWTPQRMAERKQRSSEEILWGQ